MTNKGWKVVFAGMGLNLALGVLYAWSIFGKQLTEAVENGGFGWTKTQAAMPYTIAIAIFAIMMVPAGRLQDKFGPRIVATVGAILTGLGLIVSGFATPENMMPVLIGFGVMAGMGFGLGYASATPAAVKWFASDKKGMITGIVVSGFGLAPVYIAPLSKFLLGEYGLSASFQILGASFAVVTFFLCQLIKNPPVVAAAANTSKASVPANKVDFTWRDMLRTPTFYLLWIEYACVAIAGLMIIGHLAKIVAIQSGNTIQIGFLFVALLAIFNASGRIIAGIVSDKIGRIKTLFLVCMTQAVVMFLFSSFSTITTFMIGSAVVGFSYGACLSLFPSTTADYWGSKNLGLNYGLLFTAWGVGGVFGPILAGQIADMTGNYNMAYMVSAGFLVLAGLLTFITKAPKEPVQQRRTKVFVYPKPSIAK